MGVNSLPKTVTRQCRDCDLNPGPSAPESSTLTTRLALRCRAGMSGGNGELSDDDEITSWNSHINHQ